MKSRLNAGAVVEPRLVVAGTRSSARLVGRPLKSQQSALSWVPAKVKESQLTLREMDLRQLA